ncbi:MAG TPA: MOSC domain-containing protein [Verrucomicrobiae bacterium]|nr:MOSC domain-containing protein [Verrucomicrobiae bacterium]
MDSQALLDLVRASPKDAGTLKLIVLRLPHDQRQTPPQATLSIEHGVAGDRWSLKANADPLVQISVMNSRFLEAIAGESERMNLAGDNLIVDLDLHEDNVPPGTRLRIGEVVLEVTDVPHTGCSKFERRYGKAVLDLTNTPEGSALHLRGVLARVIHGGEVRLGDTIRKEAPHA